MGESLVSHLTKTPASELSPGDRGIGVVDLGNGQPFGVAVTVLHVKQDIATVQDVGGRTYRTPSLMAVGEDVEALLEAEAQAEAEAYDEARRALYRARAQRRGTA